MREIHRSTTTWLARRTGRGSAARPPHRSHRRRLTLEPLEGRALLSLTTWTVNSLGDSGTGSGTSGDLRYVITQADQTQGDNTINFAVTGTITLNSALPDLGNTNGVTDIEGPGASSLTVARSSAAGTSDFSVFTVDSSVTANLTGLTISGGLSASGGGIENEGTLTVTNSTIDNNSAYSNSYGMGGGGIYNNGTLMVTNSTIDNNSSGFGGGIYNNYNNGTSLLTVTNSTIDDNEATGEGGGIYNAGTLTVTNSTIAYNSANAGGGIYNNDTLTVTNSTIAYNSAGSGLGAGGGIYNNDTLTVTNSTIAYNSGDGGGIFSGPTATLSNTIVALNTFVSYYGFAEPSDIAGIGNLSLAGAYNLIGTGGSGGLTNGSNGNQVGVADPGLDPNGLQNNGGPTQTIALLPNSPAIDAGSNALAVDPTTNQLLTTDQRGAGFPRVVGLAVDIGAYELQATRYVVVTTQPPATVIAGSSFGLTVTAEDSSGNVDTSFNGTVTVALATNPEGGTLGGTLSVTATNGVATFSDLTLDKAATGYTLLVSGTGLYNATTASLTVTPAAASQLVVTAQPPSTFTAGSAFGLVVTAEDPFGNVDSNFNGTVAVALLNNPGSATLGGALTTTAQSGVATLAGLTMDQPGIGYTLQVTSNGLTAAATNPFNVRPIGPVLSTFTVNSLGDTDTGSGFSGDLRYVITQVDQTPGDNTINFAVTGTITLNSALPDLSNTTGVTHIEGPGAASLTVERSSAAPDFSIFTVDANVQASLTGLTISGGASEDGGGIYNAGTLTVANSTIDDNSAYSSYEDTYGGGIYNAGTLTVTNSTIDNNSVYIGGGGGIYNAGTLTVTNSTIGNNFNGGIYNAGTLTVTNSTIDNNDGDGISSPAGTLTVTNSTIDNNEGVGIEYGGMLTLTVTNCTIDNNGGNGIGNDEYDGTATVTNSTIDNNSGYSVDYYGDTFGGGIYNAGTLTVTNSTIDSNSADRGGGIYNDFGTLTLTSCTIDNNSAHIGVFYYGSFGGGIENNDGTLTVTNSTIDNNSAEYSGVDSGIASDGGGIDNDSGTLTVTNSTIAYNSAGSGGGIDSDYTLTVTDSTIAYNSADSPGSGGGLVAFDNLFVVSTLDNTIVALNTSGSGATPDDIAGTVSLASAYNLIGTGGSGGLTNTNGNQVGVADPGLGPLAYYGGPTQTIALLTGSPAIDAGSNALAVDPSTGQPLTTDQRGPGFVRIYNGTVDIGAYEFLPAASDAVSVEWGSQSAALQTAADGLRLLPQGRTTDLPWLGIDSLQVTLSQAQTLTPADVTVSSAIGVNYGPVTVSGSGTSYTITLAQPINAADRVTITIVNPGVSMFNRRLDVLPGNVNDDGVVNVQDMVAIRNQMLGLLGAVPTIFGDINGDGTVDINDYTAVRELIGTTLPRIT